MTEPKIEPALETQTSNKYMYIIVGIIVLAFAALIIYGRLTANTVPLTLDDLHKINLEGDLSSEKGYTFNGFSFVKMDNLWYTKVQRKNKAYAIPLHFAPHDFQNVTKTGQLDPLFDKSDEIYIVINPLSPNSDYVALAAGELAQNIVTVIDRYPIGACDRNETVMCNDRPIITCATTTKPAIYLLQEDGPSVELNGNCHLARP